MPEHEWVKLSKNELDKVHYTSQLCWRMMGSDPVDCVQCHTEAKNGASYCHNCGAPLWGHIHVIK